MNKDELLKIYSAYLPYGLKLRDNVNIIRELTHKGYWHRSSENDTVFVGVDEAIDYKLKPILYDLSYLTKEIKHEGETFIPLEELLKLAVDEKDNGEACYSKDDIIEIQVRNGFAISGIVNEHSKFTIRYYAKEQIFSLFHPLGTDMHLNYKYREKLLEWHFNIFQLPEDQLINKATLTTNK